MVSAAAGRHASCDSFPVMGIQGVVGVALAAVVLGGCADLPAPRTTAKPAAVEAAPFQAVFTQTTGANVSQHRFRAEEARIWATESKSVAVFASGAIHADGCEPSFTLFFDSFPTVLANYRFTDNARLLYTEDCLDNGVSRAWHARAGDVRIDSMINGSITFSMNADMAPNNGGAVGNFKAMATGNEISVSW
jgi:hypothetical protein